MNSVIGFGIYQGMEFIAGASAWGIVSQFRVMAKRLLCNIQILWGARVYEIILGRDPEENLRAIVSFMNSLPDER